MLVKIAVILTLLACLPSMYYVKSLFNLKITKVIPKAQG